MVYYPIIQVGLSSKYKIYHRTLQCIVDSGSDFNLFPASVAESFGLVLEEGEKVIHTGIGAMQITAYKHPVMIYVGGYKLRKFGSIQMEKSTAILSINE